MEMGFWLNLCKCFHSFSFLFFSDFFVFTVKLMCKCFYFQTNLIFDYALDCQFYNDFTVRNENAIVEWPLTIVFYLYYVLFLHFCSFSITFICCYSLESK